MRASAGAANLLRSLNRLIELTSDLRAPIRPEWSTGMLFEFWDDRDLQQWRAFDDSIHGGLSKAKIGLTREGEETFLRFEGNLSHEIPDEAPWLARSGIAGFHWAAKDERHPIDMDVLGEEMAQCKRFDVVQFLLRAHERRTWVANIRSDNWAEGRRGTELDLWQARLTAPPEGTWGWAQVDLNRDFVQTRRGRITETQEGVYRQRIMAMGIALAGGIESNAGLFCLDLKAVKCTESGQLLPGGEHWGSKAETEGGRRQAYGHRGIPGGALARRSVAGAQWAEHLQAQAEDERHER